MIRESIELNSAVFTALTDPLVPMGINTGVGIEPRSVTISPDRADV